ncbi:TraB/GumN family protein [Psychroflexus planctonicus]|uniref:Lipoprotein n=1 Tax=Psychroflexus planctonicus TaxID=1526575 RepID=A0ABQ1SF02_9FLAO|nr:TraB/GumN family protein [Psychroflexus planctonicus]GGE28828.1 lipoprotein [Psychroflexus planctonicus]
MRIKISFLLVLVCCFLSVQAQDLENSLLWKVSGNGLTSDSYLFGTLHATCNTSIKPRIIEAFNQTEQLALEIDLSDPSLELAMVKHMYITDGKSMTDFLNEDETILLRDFLNEHIPTMNFAILRQIKPIFISMILLQNALPCETPKAYDDLLFEKAQAEDKPIFGLESIDDQMSVLDQIPVDEQVQELLKTAKDNMQSDQDEFFELLDVYEAEQLENLGELSLESESIFNNYVQELLDNRNVKWIAIIEKMMHEKPSFFGFGAMHLIGEKGVILLLRKLGYQVEAILP